MKVILSVFLAFTYVAAFNNSDEYINEINRKQNLWKAGRNFHKYTPTSKIRGLLGAKRLSQNVLNKVPVIRYEVVESDIPESFDARTQWSKCKTIKEVVDESACGSAWAVSVASAISDRICVHSDAKHQPEISAKNLIACDSSSYGCEGGYTLDAWLYWKNIGLVTGGQYGSKIGCQPYPFAPCEHYIHGSKPNCPSALYNTPKCIKTCDNSKINYEQNLIKGASGYLLEPDELQIQTEILKNGPVVATFTVFSDFKHYKSGVYFRTTNDVETRHAAKMIGWGVENGTKYWLVVNSWNENWGDKGLFKIRRGVNECDIENEVTAGLPKKN